MYQTVNASQAHDIESLGIRFVKGRAANVYQGRSIYATWELRKGAWILSRVAITGSLVLASGELSTRTSGMREWFGYGDVPPEIMALVESGRDALPKLVP